MVLLIWGRLRPGRGASRGLFELVQKPLHSPTCSRPWETCGVVLGNVLCAEGAIAMEIYCHIGSQTRSLQRNLQQADDAGRTRRTRIEGNYSGVGRIR